VSSFPIADDFPVEVVADMCVESDGGLSALKIAPEPDVPNVSWRIIRDAMADVTTRISHGQCKLAVV
jgi:hypothetical protein